MILSPVIRQRYFDANGNPLAGGKLYSYTAGTTTPLVTYTDQGGGTPNANPVVLDANGEANVWIDQSLVYKFILKDSNDVTQWTVDQVSGTGTSGVGGWNAGANYSQGDIVQDATGSGLLYVSLQNSNLGNALSSVAYWRMLGGAMRTLTSNTTLAVTDELVRSNSTSGALTHTLPACSSTPIGKRITIKDIGSGGFTTSVKGSGTDQVDGAVIYATALARYDSLTVINTGSAWDVARSAVPDASITTAKVAAAGLGTAAYADGSVTQAKRAALGQQISSSSGGSATTSAGSMTDITNQSVTITTTGRPVLIALQPDGSGNATLGPGFATGSPSSVVADYQLLRDGVAIANWRALVNLSSGTVFGSTTTASLMFLDVGASAGAHTYKYQFSATSPSQAQALNLKTVAFEL